MNLKAKFVSSIGLLGLLCLLLPGSLRADDFTFSFTNNTGSVAGTITGEILGLTNNATSAATVVIDTFPTAFATDPDLATPPINTANWTQFLNKFAESNGIITAAAYDAKSPSGHTELTFIINTPPFSDQTDFIFGNALVSSNGSTPVITFTPVPEPATGSLMLLGIGLVLPLRTRNSRGHQLAT